jgi:hypothetical protein
MYEFLSKNIFSKGILLNAGDHVPNVLIENNSKINHVLIGEDTKLKDNQTKFGRVKFLQVNIFV